MDASDQIMNVAKTHGHANIAKFLESVAEFEVNFCVIINCIFLIRDTNWISRGHHMLINLFFLHSDN